MKTFRYEHGHFAGKTLTVGEMRSILSDYPDDMPVMATWETVHAYVELEGVVRVDKGLEDDACDVLMFDVGGY